MKFTKNTLYAFDASGRSFVIREMVKSKVTLSPIGNMKVYIYSDLNADNKQFWLRHTFNILPK